MPHNANGDNFEKDGFLSKAIKVLTLPVAAISGYWVAARRVYVNAYDNAKDHGIFKDLVNGERKRGLDEIGKEALDAVAAHKEYDILAKSVPFHETHNAKVLERFKAVGLGTTAKRWKFLRVDQKQAAMIEFMTVAGIAVGALLTLANNKTISHAFSNNEPQETSVT